MAPMLLFALATTAFADTRCADLLAHPPVPNFQKDSRAAITAGREDARQWLERIGRATEPAACRALVEGVRAHDLITTAAERVIWAFERLCAHEPTALAELTVSALRAHEALGRQTFTYRTGTPRGPGDPTARHAVTRWLTYAADRRQLSRQWWLSRIESEWPALVFVTALGRRLADVGLSADDQNDLRARLLARVPDVRLDYWLELFGRTPADAADEIDRARPAALVDFLYLTKALNAAGLARIHDRFAALAEVDAATAKELAGETSAAVEDLIFDATIDVEVVESVVRAIFKHPWNSEKLNAHPTRALIWKEVPPHLYARAVHIMTAFPGWFPWPEETRLVKMTPVARTAWLRSQIDAGYTWELRFSQREMFRGVDETVAVRYLSALAAEYPRTDHGDESNVENRLLRVAQRVLPFASRARLMRMAPRGHAARHEYARSVAERSPAAQDQILTRIQDGFLLADVLRVSTLPAARKEQIAFAHVKPRGPRTTTRGVFPEIGRLARALRLPPARRLELLRHALRQGLGPIYDFEDQTKTIRTELKLEKTAVERALISEAFVGALTTHEDVLGNFGAIDGSKLLTLNSPFDLTLVRLERFARANSKIDLERQLAWIRGVTGNTAVAFGYFRVLNPPAGPIDPTGKPETEFWAEILGWPTATWRGIKPGERDRRVLRSLVLDLEHLLGAAALANRATAPAGDRAGARAYAAVLGQLRTFARLKSRGVFYHRLALDEVWPADFALTPASAPRLLRRLEEATVELVRTALDDSDHSYTYADLARVDREFGGFDAFYTLLGRVDAPEARPHLRAFLHHALRGESARYKYEGNADDPADVARAAAQLAGLSDAAERAWRTPRAHARLLAPGGVDRAALERARRATVADVIRQTLAHARDAGLTADALTPVLTARVAEVTTTLDPAAAVAALANEPRAEIFAALFDRLGRAAGLDEITRAVRPLLILLSREHALAPALTTQLESDLREIDQTLRAPVETAGEAILVAATLVHPKSALRLGALAAAASCLDVDFGSHVSALISHLIDANLGIVVGYALPRPEFARARDYDVVAAALTRGDAVAPRLDEVPGDLHFTVGDRHIVTKPQRFALHRQVVRVGQADDGTPALATERAYGPLHPAKVPLGALVDGLLNDLATDLGGSFGGPVTVVGTRSRLGGYSDSVTNGRVSFGMTYVVGR